MSNQNHLLPWQLREQWCCRSMKMSWAVSGLSDWLCPYRGSSRAGNVKITEMVIFGCSASTKWYFLKKKEVQNCPLQAHKTDMEILLIHISPVSWHLLEQVIIPSSPFSITFMPRALPSLILFSSWRALVLSNLM